MALRIVLISDTHALHRQIAVPAGDILIHAGDFTRKGEQADVVDFNAWLGELPHRHKIVIAGNHDRCFEADPAGSAALLTNAVYLQDQALTVEGLSLYGSPWQPEFFDWAFNLPRGPELAAVWARIPERTDILITHGPPRGYGDRTIFGTSAGCDDLLEAIDRVRPRYHIFGHIHEGYGAFERNGMRLFNASIVTFNYRPANPPIVIDLE